MGWVENASSAVDAASEYRLIIGVTVSMTVLSVAVVATRLRIRHAAHGLQADDHMSSLSAFFAVLYSALCVAQTKYGLGLPLKLRPAENLIPFTRINYAGRPIYQLGISFFKVALLISYLRLFQGTSLVIYRRIVWVAIVLILAGHLGCSLALILACDPVYKSWEPATPGRCLPAGPSFTGYAVVTIVSDLAVTLIPIPVLLQLKVDTGKKAGLVFIFVLGLFTTLCSIFRYLQIDRIQNGDGNSTMLVLWGVIEFNVGNMVSSLPFLAPVFMRKTKALTNRYPKAYGSSGSRGRDNSLPKLGLGKGGGGSGGGGGGGDAYKLSSISQGKGVFGASTARRGHGASEEDILKDVPPDHSILKSVSYSVRVEDEEFKSSHGR